MEDALWYRARRNANETPDWRSLCIQTNKRIYLIFGSCHIETLENELEPTRATASTQDAVISREIDVAEPRGVYQPFEHSDKS